MSKQKNKSDFIAMNVVELKKYSQERGVSVSGYLKTSLVEIATTTDVQRCSDFKIKALPGASVDNIQKCQCSDGCPDSVIEYKCPSKHRDLHPREAFLSPEIGGIKDGNKFALKPTAQYYFQVQLQMVKCLSVNWPCVILLCGQKKKFFLLKCPITQASWKAVYVQNWKRPSSTLPDSKSFTFITKWLQFRRSNQLCTTKLFRRNCKQHLTITYSWSYRSITVHFPHQTCRQCATCVTSIAIGRIWKLSSQSAWLMTQ